jgi:hypothetical protein
VSGRLITQEQLDRLTDFLGNDYCLYELGHDCAAYANEIRRLWAIEDAAEKLGSGEHLPTSPGLQIPMPRVKPPREEAK